MDRSCSRWGVDLSVRIVFHRIGHPLHEIRPGRYYKGAEVPALEAFGILAPLPLEEDLGQRSAAST